MVFASPLFVPCLHKAESPGASQAETDAPGWWGAAWLPRPALPYFSAASVISCVQAPSGSLVIAGFSAETADSSVATVSL